ncbi:MAG TPA: kelch repeat-containing protein [Candidatus Sulfotelmatobacter sp.]|nr:kelch repeat-containing protein [Candidatus Sulfotelmatobacter sp.]
MNRRLLLLFPIAFSLLLPAADQPKIPAMPVAVTSNAVASLRGGIEVYSMMGLGTKKTWDEVSNKMYELGLRSGKWIEGHAVPGVAGRLGASAVGVRGQVFLFGGYTIDGQEGETVVGDVNSYLPQDHRWYRAEDIPVPVDSAVIGATHDRYIYLVGGRSRSGPVNNVQVYDVEKNAWSQATAFPGTPVFGHAGAIVDEVIVYVDGAKKDSAGGKYVASDECWMGKLDHKDPNKIEWSKLPAHPGPGRFGIVAGAGEHDHRILFSGGTTVPHNYKGLDSEGKPAELSPVTFDFELHGNKWETITEDTYDVRADSRGIVFTPLGPLILGGTLKNSAVSARVLILPKK